MRQDSHRGDVVHAVRRNVALLVTVEPVEREATTRRVVCSPSGLIGDPRRYGGLILQPVAQRRWGELALVPVGHRGEKGEGAAEEPCRVDFRRLLRRLIYADVEVRYLVRRRRPGRVGGPPGPWCKGGVCHPHNGPLPSTSGGPPPLLRSPAPARIPLAAMPAFGCTTRVSRPPLLGRCPPRRPRGSGRPHARSGRPPPLPFRPAWSPHPPRLWFCGGLLPPASHGTKCPACRWGPASAGGRWPGRAAPRGLRPHGAHGGGFVGPGRAQPAAYPPC